MYNRGPGYFWAGVYVISLTLRALFRALFSAGGNCGQVNMDSVEMFI